MVHAYLLHDLIYETERTDACFVEEGGEVVGYVLVWRGPRVNAVHVWGRADSLLDRIPRDRRAVVVVYDRGLLGRVVGELEKCGEVEVREYLTMSVREGEFRPRVLEGVVRLRADNEDHVAAYARLKAASGTPLTPEEARTLLSRRRYYGLFRGGELVSMACAYVRLPEVWAVGDVFTHPDHRGRGYAKAVTSAVTRDAVTSGAVAMLHVERGNEPALRVYRALGYREEFSLPWVVFRPR